MSLESSERVLQGGASKSNERTLPNKFRSPGDYVSEVNRFEQPVRKEVELVPELGALVVAPRNFSVESVAAHAQKNLKK